MPWLVFAVVAAGAVLSAVGLVVRTNPLHGALFLVANLFCVAVLYLVQRAEFLALAQVIVYAGAIMVLFVFAIMLLVPGRAETGPDPLRGARRLAVPVATGLGLVVVLVVARTGGGGSAPPPTGVGALGRLLFTDYLFPFEVTSLLLLAALVGALVLAKRTPG
ncbi:MAG: NADH-quinone oxidoreductase subunit J [Candidatus Rokuibacteriota bacterium]|nr:MAG: NADH-quinone oxidoreductase subunit J [Candidatus Rokubacteria bacterium]